MPGGCARCGAELPDGARFCPACGRPAFPAPQDEEEPEYPATERKQVTVLFADFSGFTAFSSELDAEEVRDQMAALWERLDGIITSHGGHVEKHIGDAIMAMFGARQAHEDDPAQAVRAALAIQRCLDEGTRLGTLPPLPMRVGIHTGLVVVGLLATTREFAATGDTVNVASRLEHHAPPGGVLISRETYRQVYGLFTVQERPALAIEGKSEAVQTYLVLRAKPRAIALQLRGIEGVETELVGRELELKRLQSGLRSVVEDRELRVVTVVGEAGIGKSRLWTEFQRWVDLLPETFRFFYGRATAEMASLPFSLMRSVFSSRFEIQESDSAAVAREKLQAGLLNLLENSDGALAWSKDDLSMMVHFIGQLLGLDFSDRPSLRELLNDPEQIRTRAFHYLTNLFRAVTSGSYPAPGMPSVNGTLLVLDDMHFSDDGSLDVIDHLARTCQGVPLMIICLTRPVLFERRPAWGEGVAAHTRLNLDPLSPRDGRALVESILRRAPSVPASLRELIVGGAEGNPFYIEEIIKMLIDRRIIVPGAQRWKIETSQFVETRVPATLAGVLQARVDALSPLERAVLQRASVVGRVFWDLAIGCLNSGAEPPPLGGAPGGGTLTQHQVIDALASLRRKELIYRRESSSFAGATEYTFKHELLRNVVYESVLKKVRRGYHVQVAAWLIEHSGERISECTGLVAAHFERAGRAPEAADWYGRAGQQARKGYTPATASECLRKALDLLPAEPDSRPEALERRLEWCEGLGEALAAQARYDEGLEIYNRMRTLAETTQNHLAQARAWNGLAFLHERRGNNRASLDAAERAEALARQAGEGGRREQIRALQLKGWACYRLGDAPAVLALGDQTLRLCTESGDRPGMATSFKLHGVAHLQLGHFAEADRYFEQGLALCQESGDRRNAGAMWSNLGESARLRGDCQAAAILYQKALAIVRQIGHRESELIYLSNLNGARLGLGQYSLAEEGLREVIALAGKPGAGTRSETYTFLAEACLGQGKLAEALKAARRALALAQASENYLDMGGAWRALGRATAACLESGAGLPTSDGEPGQPAHEPGACFAEALRIFKQINADGEQARTLLAWAEFELRKDQRQQGEDHLAEARAIQNRLGVTGEVAKANAA